MQSDYSLSATTGYVYMLLPPIVYMYGKAYWTQTST